MPRIEFHTGISDPLAFTCRLLRKAYRQGARLVVTGPATTLRDLDRTLWTFDERDFIPHAWVHRGAADDAAARLSPIWLLDAELPTQHASLLVNVGGAVESLVERFERVIEVVSTDTDIASQARLRWRTYRDRGYPIQHHGAASGQ